jgi:hypothetical protein
VKQQGLDDGKELRDKPVVQTLESSSYQLWAKGEVNACMQVRLNQKHECRFFRTHDDDDRIKWWDMVLKEKQRFNRR